MAKNQPALTPPLDAPQPRIEIHAGSISLPPAPTERERQLEAEVARLRAELEKLGAAAKAVGLTTPSAEPGIGAGATVTLIEYSGDPVTISETTATVVAQLGNGMLRVQPRGLRSTVDVAPHDGALGVKERVGYTGYTYADPLAEGLAQGLLS